MQQWEAQRQKRIHDARIRNAKPTIKRKPAPSESQDCPDTRLPLLPFLKRFHLQQYSKKLSDLGLDTESLLMMDGRELKELCDQIKALPGHLSKFEALQGHLWELEERAATAPVSAPDPRQYSSERATYYAPHPLTDDDLVEQESALGLEEQQNSETERLKEQLEEAARKIKLLEDQLRAPKPQDTSVRSEKPIEPPKIPVGVSYDSARMKSTLAHIDVEEMCRCLSKAVRKHVEHGAQVSAARLEIDDAPLRESLLSMPDFLGDASGGKPSLNYYVTTSSATSRYSSTLECSDDSVVLTPHMPQISEASDESSPSFVVQNPPMLEDVKVPKGLERMFEEVFNDFEAATGVLPEEVSIYNFAKNFIIMCRMEKEVSVICLIYLERMIALTSLYVTEKNWKKLLVISLLLASKVWDDESFENSNVAQVFTLYSLQEINEMERLFLSFIDYQVQIPSSEYAKYYFILRTYSQHSAKSFPLQPLDVDTVRKLQRNGEKAEETLRGAYGESMNKTL